MDRLSRTGISRSELQLLIAHTGGPCVTIYLPLERRCPHSAGNPVHLRGVLDRAVARLREWGLSEREANTLLRPTREIEWQSDLGRAGAAEGLAVLIAPALLRVYQLPYHCPESVDVGETFYLAPLMRLLTWPVAFCLLALSGNGVRLYRGSREALVPLELPAEVPRSLEAYTAGTEVGRAVRFQSSAGVGATGGSIGLIHGQTSPKDDAKLRLQEYVQAVAKGLGPLTVQGPLVLAAVGALHPPFRAAYSGQNLLEPGVHGSPDELIEAEMQAESVRLVEQRHVGELRTACEHFGRAAGTSRASRSLKEIAPAAAEGQVELVIAAYGQRVWGQWDAEVRQVSAEEAATAGESDGRPGQVDLLDLALRETLRHGGQVWVVSPEHVPGGGAIAAVYRWSPP